jgi:hypothetical protein
MFRNTAPAAEPPADVVMEPAALIPLSVLQLDLDPPAGGWDAYLTDRGVAIVLDHIGRNAISSADARQLFDEKREGEVRAREVAQQREREAVERDRISRAQLSSGVPWWQLPADVSPARAIMQAGLDAERGKSVREQLLDQELSHSYALGE